MPLLKDSFKQVWQKYESLLDETCLTKFRTYQDVTVRLPLIWSIFQGNFCQVPDMYYGPQIELSSTTIDRALAILQQSKTISVCLNDSFKTREEEVPELESKLIEAFTRKFPEKFSFEK